MKSIFNDRIISPRVWSAVLFVSGIFVAFAITELQFAPWAYLGYLLWIAFGLRVFWTPSLAIRRVFWNISVTWHMWCLIPAILLFPFVLRLGGTFGLIPLIGWCFAALFISLWMRGVDTHPNLTNKETEQGGDGDAEETV